MKSCIFCEIIKDAHKKFAYQDDKVVAFDDIAPQAPHHVLIVPRRHIATLNELTASDGDLVAHVMQTAIDIAKKRKIAENGYRLVWNCNRDGGQAVYHIHLHLLGGRPMGWPPG